MLTMGKSMRLEQVELRHEICVAAAARSVDGVVAPVVAATTHNSPDRVSSKGASQRHVRSLQQVVGREEDREGRARIQKAPADAGEEGARPLRA